MKGAVRVVSVKLRDFRSYGSGELFLGDRLTVAIGPNGAGKTNLLEAVYFAATGRSCRTSNDREVVSFHSGPMRLEMDVESDEGRHTLAVGFAPGELKRMTVDGSAVERLVDHPSRPLMSVFLPDRLELIKGPPALRRAHLDQLVAALWPTRIATRRSYNQALAQRNALLMRLRAGIGSRESLLAWDEQLATHGIALIGDRTAALRTIAPVFTEVCARLGMGEEVSIRYRPRSSASAAEEFVGELRSRLDRDIERGFTGHGPHRDEFVIEHGGRELRTYGSQGQQRMGLLALLLAERSVIADTRSTPPVLLLDDVMSELDRDRRACLVEVVSDSPGQVLITTTDLEHVPGAETGGMKRIWVEPGSRLLEFDRVEAMR